jgi:hypothetical protein
MKLHIGVGLEPMFVFRVGVSGSVKLRCDLGSGWSDGGAAVCPASCGDSAIIFDLESCLGVRQNDRN